MDDEDSIPANGSAAFTVESWMTPYESNIKSLWEWPHPEDTPLQIALCGAGGTGKTKLATLLGQALDLVVIEGIPRTVNRLGGKLNKHSNWTDEFMIFLAQVWEQMEYREFVSAGSLIDLVAYCHYFVQHSDDPKDKYLLRGLSNVAATISNNDYSVIFYLPLPERIKANGIRSVDMRFQKEIDKLIKYYLNAYDLDYFPLQGTVDENATTALNYLSDFGLLSDRD